MKINFFLSLKTWFFFVKNILWNYLNVNDAFSGFALVHGLIMVKEQVGFTHATVMKQQNKREW